MDTRIIIVAAVAENNIIGCDGDLPWALKSDLRRFKTLTEGGVVFMGRKTFESIRDRLGSPLPNRRNLVLTSQIGLKERGFRVVHSLAEALLHCSQIGAPALFVIGGESVYQNALLHADELHLTIVHAKPNGDVRFPLISELLFEQCEAMRFPADPGNGDEHDFSFTIFRRRHRSVRKSTVYLPHARKPQQWAIMERIQLDDVCPFCPEHLAKYHKQEILAETTSWIVTKSQWPYPNTKVHLLVIPRRHIEHLDELHDKEWADLGELIRSATKAYGITSGGLGIRFGDSAKNGGSVRHLHFQLMQVATTNPKDPGYQKVRFGLG